MFALKKKKKKAKQPRIGVFTCSVRMHSHRVLQGRLQWDKDLEYLSGLTDVWLVLLRRWRAEPYLSLLDLALNLRNRVMGRAKAMLAFQFMVLPVQDTSNSYFFFLFFFYSRYQKYFLWLVFIISAFRKAGAYPKGESSSWGSGCEVHLYQPCCSTAPARCWAARADRGSREGVGCIPVVLTRRIQASKEQDLHFRIKWDTVVMFLFFLIWSHTFFLK